jgi:integrase
MKTKAPKRIRSPGSLLVRGSNFYCFWRHKGKAICRALRDENGAAITTRPEAERAKARLMDIVNKENEVKTLRSIQHAIDDKQSEIDRLNDAKNPPMPLARVWSAFASPTSGHKPCEKSSLKAYENIWTQFQAWLESHHPGVKTLLDVKRDIAKGYLDSIAARGVSNKTINIHLSTLRYIFKVLADDAKLTENVWLKFTQLPVMREGRRELTIDELTVVCGKATGEMKTLFCIGLYTGLRLGDCATLKWGEVDLKRELIRRIPNKIRRKKGANGMVQISIHPVLHDALSTLPASKTQGYVLPEMSALYLAGQRSQLTNHIQEHFEACGINTKRDRQNGVRRVVEVGFHSFRHTFVSMCAMNNVPLSVVQSLVGHSSPLMTGAYTHSNRLAEQQAIGLLPSLNGDIVTIPTKRTHDELLRELIESMTAGNWRAKKSAVLTMLA